MCIGRAGRRAGGRTRGAARAGNGAAGWGEATSLVMILVLAISHWPPASASRRIASNCSLRLKSHIFSSPSGRSALWHICRNAAKLG